MIIQQTNIGLARYMACTRVKSKQFLEWKIWNKKKAWNKQMQKKKKEGNIQMGLQETGGLFVDWSHKAQDSDK